MQLEQYVEVIKSSNSGLTYPALVGSRKQSVEDAERMFSPSLLKFMENKGYQCEADYIHAVLGWREACDTRGISQLQRCKKNYKMLNFLLEELMPWATDSYDFSYLEVNRFVFLEIAIYSCLTGLFSHDVGVSLQFVDLLGKFYQP